MLNDHKVGWSSGLSALLLAVAFLLNLGRPQYPDLLATCELLLGLVILLSFGWSASSSSPVGRASRSAGFAAPWPAPAR